jgi:hypothetical protein
MNVALKFIPKSTSLEVKKLQMITLKIVNQEHDGNIKKNG